MRTTVIGFFIAIAIFYFGIIGSVPDTRQLLDVKGLLIVVGGTLSAGIITFGLMDIIQITKNSIKIFMRPKLEVPKVIDELQEIGSYISSGASIVGLSKRFNDSHPFIKDGLRLIENNLEEAEIEQILTEDLEQRKENQLYEIDVLKTLAKYPPAFGMMGTVIGLVGVLGSLDKSGSDKVVGASMAVALLTTLYGLLISNYVFTPISDNLLHRLSRDYAARQVIIKGILLLHKKTDPLLVNEFLKIHLEPSKRVKNQVA